jgi:hypothetical protein
MKNVLFILAVISGFAAVSSARADTSYDCTGGSGDVSFSVNAKQELMIMNSECNVRMVLKSKAAQFSAFKGVEASDSDVDLCGASATVSTGVLSGESPVVLNLVGGESGGTYHCAIAQQ